MSCSINSQRKNAETGYAFEAMLCRRARLVPNQAPLGFAPGVDLDVFAVRGNVHTRPMVLRTNGTGH